MNQHPRIVGARLAACAAMCAAALVQASPAAAPEKVPVVFDTDIGGDIDDLWALAMLLKSPQFDIKLITTSDGCGEIRAKLVAKMLTIAGRTDIPVGMSRNRSGSDRYGAWAEDFDLSKYPSRVYQDAPTALIEAIHAAPKPLTVIAVGPLQTVSNALKDDPTIASKAHFIGMHGSVRKGYGGSEQIAAEWNVRRAPADAQRVLSAPWKSITITPLDTCGLVRLTGDRFLKLRDSDDAVLQGLMEAYVIWAKKTCLDELNASSVLFDTVAVYLGYTGRKELLKLEQMPISVDAKGFTRIDLSGTKMQVATEWTDLDGYYDLLVEVLTSLVAKP